MTELRTYEYDKRKHLPEIAAEEISEMTHTALEGYVIKNQPSYEEALDDFYDDDDPVNAEICHHATKTDLPYIEKSYQLILSE